MKKITRRIVAFVLMWTIVFSLGAATENVKAAASKPEFYSNHYEFMFSPEWDTYLEIGVLDAEVTALCFVV